MRSNPLGLLCGAVMLTAMTITSFAQAPPGAPGQGGARQGRGGQRGGFGRVTVSTIPASVLRSELGLSTDQTAKIAAIQAKAQEDRKGLFPAPAPGAQPDPAARQEAMQKMQALNKQVTTDINAVLTDDQKAKLPEVIKGLQVYTGLGIPLEVLPAVKFSDDQQTQIKAIAEEHTKALADARTNNQGDRQAAMAARQAADMASQTKLLAVITPEQKVTIEKYIKAHPRPQFGGGQRGGGRPGGAGAAAGNNA